MSVKNAVYHDPQAIAWVHGKCYSKQFITLNNITFPEFRFYEDGAFNLVAFELCKKIAQNETPTYGWMHNDSSVTRSQDYNVTIRHNYFTSFIRAYRILKTLRPERARAIPLRCLLFAYHYDMALSQRGVTEEILHSTRYIIKDLIDESGILKEIVNNAELKNMFVDMHLKAKNAVIVQEGPYAELETFYAWFQRCFNVEFPLIVLR
jgi:hypothetical protein